MADKPSLGLLLMGKPKGEPDAASEGDTGQLNAAKAIIKAVKDNDATALSEALQLHYQLCEMPEESGESETA